MSKRPMTGNIAKRPNGRWRARYRDGAGKEHARHFTTKKAAAHWLNEITAAMTTGAYVAPDAGKITFKQYAEYWRTKQTHRPSTVEQVERHLRNHVYPSIGDRRLDTLRHTDMQALAKTLDENLSTNTASVIWRYVGTIFRAAVEDKRIVDSPCRKVRGPKPKKTKVAVMLTEQVTALREAVPDRYAALIVTAAGTGMRQGELFGLTIDRINFLRQQITVDRQLIGLAGREPEFGPPKTEDSDRIIPLPAVVAQALAVHLQKYATGPDGLVFTNTYGAPLRRSNFGATWRRACQDADVHGFTFHDLRHYYASLLIRHGESAETVRAMLGHKTAMETWKTYAHMWPDSDERTRAAVDSVLGASAVADSVRTAPATM